MLSTVRRLVCGVALTASLLLLGACAGPGEDFDRGRLERLEDLTESLANDLLALSVAVRDDDYEKVAAYFRERVESAPLPQAPPPLHPVADWIDAADWPLSEASRSLSREEFLKDLRAFFGRLSEREDVRFKVKGAEFDEAASRVAAHLKFFVVGRDGDGQREWLKGTATIEAEQRGEDPWRIDRFEPESLKSKVSRIDLFSEVAFPAGLAEVFPAFGVGKNQGFVSHGAATADVNGDGLLDLAATGVDQNYLYINKGDGTFRDVSEASLVKFVPIGSGVLFLDFDNDGDQDLFLAAVGRQVLLENRFIPDREIKFWDVSERAGVDRPAVGFSAVSADVNRDGYPDIYVCSYNHYGTVMPNSWIRATNGTNNLLFLNRRDGTFREVAGEWGVADGRWSYAAGFVDIDEDGDQDLYVANDFGENALYRNDGDRFEDIAAAAGVMDSGFGMGVSFGDYDNDGDLDLHVTNMSSTAGNRILALLYPEEHRIREELTKQAEGNSLYENRGDGTFENVTRALGGLSGGWGFGGGFIDYDNDGWQDLYTPNGFVSGKSMKDT